MTYMFKSRQILKQNKNLYFTLNKETYMAYMFKKHTNTKTE